MPPILQKENTKSEKNIEGVNLEDFMKQLKDVDNSAKNDAALKNIREASTEIINNQDNGNS